MRMLVLGAGLQGSACAFDLLQQDAVQQVTLADIQPDRAAAFVKPFAGKKLALAKLDVQDPAALRATLGGHTAVMNALPYYFNLDVTRAAVEVGLPLRRSRRQHRDRLRAEEAGCGGEGPEGVR